MQNETLIKQIEELEQWRSAIDREQLKFPVDRVSSNILQRNLLVPTGIEVVPIGLLNAPFYVAEVTVNDKAYWVQLAGKY